MPVLAQDLTVNVRWSQQVDERLVLVASGAAIPLDLETVAGRQDVKRGSRYEVELKAGTQRILHAAGSIPSAKETPPSFTADAWIRCRVSDDGELQYDLHIGPAGMDQPKAVHRGRIRLAPVGGDTAPSTG